jgi:DNA topoisomerase-1
MTANIAGFDKKKAREMIEKGRRSRWWQRKGTKSRGFSYVDSTGKKVTTKTDLERITLLVIPPAWKHVRINPSSGGRIQVVGMDTTGRIQYLYHSSFSKKQKRRNFAKIERFGKFLPKLKKATNKDIARDGLPREKVLAVIMRLINSLYFRVGSDLSERHYKTYGITTLQKKHLTVGKKGKLVFDFIGKSHIQHRKVIVDEELAGVVRELMSLGRGRKLFRYLDEQGKARAISPSQINAYLKEATDPEFSSKDFRTWGGTLLAAVELAEIGPPGNENEARKNIVKAVKKVAEELGNTPAVCRDSYIHPVVLDKYRSGTTLNEFRPRRARRIKRIEADYEPEEKALLKLFQSHSESGL